jgi:hypothetical protein
VKSTGCTESRRTPETTFTQETPLDGASRTFSSTQALTEVILLPTGFTDPGVLTGCNGTNQGPPVSAVNRFAQGNSLLLSVKFGVERT